MADSLFSTEFASAANAAQLGGIEIPIPDRMRWDMSRFPLKLYRNRRGSFSTNLKVREIAGIKAIFDGLASGATKVVFAKRSQANDSGNGLTEATAKQSVRSAIAVGEADSTATAVLCMVAPGDYEAATSMVTTGNLYPSKPTAVIGYGGEVIISTTASTLNWTLDSGASYKVIRSNVARIISRVSLDARGNGIPFAMYASKAAYDAAVGDAYYLDTSGSSSGGTANTLYAKHGDGRVLSGATVRVMLNAAACRPGNQHFYTSGVTWMGGIAAVLQKNDALTTMNIGAERCNFLYPGPDGGLSGAGCRADINGIMAINECLAGYMLNDAYSATGDYGNGDTHALIMSCEGYEIGAVPALSCNMTTGHKNTTSIVTNPIGTKSAGGAHRYVDDARAFILGGRTSNDRGDGMSGGGTPSSALNAGNTAEIYAIEHSIDRCLHAMITYETGKIFYRDVETGGGLITQAAAGSIVTF